MSMTTNERYWKRLNQTNKEKYGTEKARQRSRQADTGWRRWRSGWHDRGTGLKVTIISPGRPYFGSGSRRRTAARRTAPVADVDITHEPRTGHRRRTVAHRRARLGLDPDEPLAHRRLSLTRRTSRRRVFLSRGGSVPVPNRRRFGRKTTRRSPVQVGSTVGPTRLRFSR